MKIPILLGSYRLLLKEIVKQRRAPFVFSFDFFCYRLLHFLLEMAETDEFNVEDQLNYEAETGEGGEGEVFIMLN